VALAPWAEYRVLRDGRSIVGEALAGGPVRRPVL